MKIAYTRPDMGVPANDPSLIREVDRVGTARMWFLDGKLHREDGPAVECPDGSRFWYRNGERTSEEEFEARKPRFSSWTSFKDLRR